MNIECIKTVRCGEPEKAKSAASPELAKLIHKHCGPNGRFNAGGRYVNVPDELGKALVKAKAAKEV